MFVEVKDWDKAISIVPAINEGGVYTISVTFEGDEVMTYGYKDRDKFLMDYRAIGGKV